MTAEGRMMSVLTHVNSDGGFEPGQPQMLFQTRPVPKVWNLYDVTPDGRRFSVNVPVEWANSPITVAANWAEKLKEWVPAAKGACDVCGRAS
jgi:hypothetical protein